jgi:nitrogen fixation protein NifU and related proteins
MQTDLYHATIMDHYRFPRNRGILSNAHVQSEVINHSCGDSIEFYAHVDQNNVTSVRFHGKGCVISQAAASILSEHINNKSITDILTITANQIRSLVGIQLGPTRLRCALLGLEAVHKGLASHARSQ